MQRPADAISPPFLVFILPPWQLVPGGEDTHGVEVGKIYWDIFPYGLCILTSGD